MINFEEEIKKFSPSLEIGDIEKAVSSNSFADVDDILFNVIREDLSKKGSEALSSIMKEYEP